MPIHLIRAGRRADGARGASRPGRLALAAAAVALALSGCASLASDGAGAAPGGDGSGDGSGGATDPATPVLQVSQGGGFVPVGFDFSNPPMLTLYEDGRAITQGPVIQVFPGPALPNLRVTQLTQEEVETILEAAREAGLAQELEWGNPPTADAPTTFVTVRLDGETYEHQVPSLGFGDGALPGEMPEGEEIPGVTEEQREARAALSELIATAQGIVDSAGEGESYDIEAFAIQARPVDPSQLEPVDGIERDRMVWPVEADLADAAECAVVDGAGAEALVAALHDANQLTVWESGGEVYEVSFRPLLPGEEGCDDV